MFRRLSDLEINIFVCVVKQERTAFAAGFGFKADAAEHHIAVNVFHHVVNAQERQIEASQGFGGNAAVAVRLDGQRGLQAGQLNVNIEINLHADDAAGQV